MFLERDPGWVLFDKFISGINLFKNDPYKSQIVVSRLAGLRLLQSAHQTIPIAQQKLALPIGEIEKEQRAESRGAGRAIAQNAAPKAIAASGVNVKLWLGRTGV